MHYQQARTRMISPDCQSSVMPSQPVDTQRTARAVPHSDTCPARDQRDPGSAGDHRGGPSGAALGAESIYSSPQVPRRANGSTDLPARVCSCCRTWKPLSEFNRNRSRPGGFAYECRDCHREYNRAYRQTDCFKESQRKSRLKNLHKYRANGAVFRALKSGRLTRPSTCSECGAEGFIEAHHDSYAREHWLVVRWLCHRCHCLADHPPVGLSAGEGSR